MQHQRLIGPGVSAGGELLVEVPALEALARPGRETRTLR